MRTHGARCVDPKATPGHFFLVVCQASGSSFNSDGSAFRGHPNTAFSLAEVFLSKDRTPQGLPTTTATSSKKCGRQQQSAAQSWCSLWRLKPFPMSLCVAGGQQLNKTPITTCRTVPNGAMLLSFFFLYDSISLVSSDVTGHVGFSLPGGGGGSIEPPKTGGGGSGKGLN